ncbi:MAG: gfo/Idh/MocA family oxidoreductase, partial [Paenibacillus sp.]|nr:gfo/Idh/MocA family oxidoreductase [Paenibacillus sp.]
EGGLKLTPHGKGPSSGVWDGKVGSMTIFHDIRGHLTESPIPVKEHTINLFNEKVKDFVSAIREGRGAPIPGEEILYNQAIIDGVLRSTELGREVEIKLP